MKTKTFLSLIFLQSVMLFLLSGCFPQAISSNSCGDLVSDDDTRLALSYVSFDVPENWFEVDKWERYSTGPALLSVFVFDSSESTVKGCVEKMRQVIQYDTDIANYKLNSTDLSVDGTPAIMALADGYKDENPYRAVHVGFSHQRWVYVFAFDAFGLDAIDMLTDDAIEIIRSIELEK